MLELDHVFCFVEDPRAAAGRALAAGWRLDDGIEHPGQGTRNRRLVFAEQYLELVWISAPADAATNQLRLDRRARWRETGASPFGIGLRGARRPSDADFVPYRPPYAPDFVIWVHRANDDDPSRPFLFVMETDDLPRFRARLAGSANPGRLARVILHGPSPAFPWLAGLSPAVEMIEAGAPRMEVVVDRAPIELADHLALTTPPAPAPPR